MEKQLGEKNEALGGRSDQREEREKRETVCWWTTTTTTFLSATRLSMIDFSHCSQQMTARGLQCFMTKAKKKPKRKKRAKKQKTRRCGDGGWIFLSFFDVDTRHVGPLHQKRHTAPTAPTAAQPHTLHTAHCTLYTAHCTETPTHQAPKYRDTDTTTRRDETRHWIY